MKKLGRMIMATLFFAGSVSTATAGADVSKMKDALNKKAAVFSALHKRASRNLQTAAQDKTFSEYFETTDKSEKKRLKAEIENLSLAVQKKFEVDEMCLIDLSGQEITRIVFDKIAPDADLSSEEASAPFFNPSVAKEARQVYISAPYLSADSKRWVIAYTTPIMTKDGKKAAILHYEIPLSVYQEKLVKEFKGKDEYILAVGKDGLLWADSRRTYNLKGNPEKEVNPSDYFPPLDKDIRSSIKNGKSGEGSFEKGGKSYSIVYKPLGYQDWSLAVVSPE
ncbi:MAG: cache domain-containing protein [Thermodesulfobacteriota bacterium]